VSAATIRPRSALVPVLAVRPGASMFSGIPSPLSIRIVCVCVTCCAAAAAAADKKARDKQAAENTEGARRILFMV
jgi:hypothetical protein